MHFTLLFIQVKILPKLDVLVANFQWCAQGFDRALENFDTITLNRNQGGVYNRVVSFLRFAREGGGLDFLPTEGHLLKVVI